MDFFEQSIKTYSGLSTETKPTVAAGVYVPNGSRWREVDTENVWFYNLSDDTWYDMGQASSALEGSVRYDFVQDNNSEILLSAILKELKKMNIHLSLMTDNYITNAEVE